LRHGAKAPHRLAFQSRSPAARGAFFVPLRQRPKRAHDGAITTPAHSGGNPMKTSIFAGVGTCAILAVAAVSMAPSSPRAQGAVPRYAFDASWNKPFPNNWINGGLGGLCVDAQDHVLVLNRQDVNKPEL